jgi:hypothetical protein
MAATGVAVGAAGGAATRFVDFAILGAVLAFGQLWIGFLFVAVFAARGCVRLAALVLDFRATSFFGRALVAAARLAAFFFGFAVFFAFVARAISLPPYRLV